MGCVRSTSSLAILACAFVAAWPLARVDAQDHSGKFVVPSGTAVGGFGSNIKRLTMNDLLNSMMDEDDTPVSLMVALRTLPFTPLGGANTSPGGLLTNETVNLLAESTGGAFPGGNNETAILLSNEYGLSDSKIYLTSGVDDGLGAAAASSGGLLSENAALLMAASSPQHLTITYHNDARSREKLSKGARTKRGVGWGFTDNSGNVTGIEEMVALNSGISWWFNWLASSTKEILEASKDLGLEYIPTQWGQWGVDALEQEILKLDPLPRAIMGFNEPNHIGQAALTGAQAAALWPKVEWVARKYNMSLGGPAAAGCGTRCLNHGVFEWYEEFFAACDGCLERLDFMTTHYYSCSVAASVNYLSSLYEKYKKPIWLKEFACPVGYPKKPGNFWQPYLYVRKMLDFLDDAPYVERYAYFAPRTTGDFLTAYSSLLVENQTTMHALGDLYINHNIDPDFRANADLTLNAYELAGLPYLDLLPRQYSIVPSEAPSKEGDDRVQAWNFDCWQCNRNVTLSADVLLVVAHLCGECQRLLQPPPAPPAQQTAAATAVVPPADAATAVLPVPSTDVAASTWVPDAAAAAGVVPDAAPAAAAMVQPMVTPMQMDAAATAANGLVAG